MVNANPHYYCVSAFICYKVHKYLMLNKFAKCWYFNNFLSDTGKTTSGNSNNSLGAETEVTVGNKYCLWTLFIWVC